MDNKKIKRKRKKLQRVVCFLDADVKAILDAESNKDDACDKFNRVDVKVKNASSWGGGEFMHRLLFTSPWAFVWYLFSNLGLLLITPSLFHFTFVYPSNVLDGKKWLKRKPRCPLSDKPTPVSNRLGSNTRPNQPHNNP